MTMGGFFVQICAGSLIADTMENVSYLLLLANVLQAPEQLCVGQLGEAHDGAAALDRLDDLRRVVACERKARCVRVELHGPAHCLLCGRSHAGQVNCQEKQSCLQEVTTQV